MYCATGDGSINFVEFRQLMNKYQTTVDKDSRLESVTESSVVHRHRGVDQELRDAFHVFDKDQDGFLNAFDLRSVKTKLILFIYFIF